jgi:hypothetical protein
LIGDGVGELGTVMQMPAKLAIKALVVRPIMARRMLAVWPEEGVSASPAEEEAVEGKSNSEGRGNGGVG